MRTPLTASLLLGAALLAAAGPITSLTIIEPGKQFVLGGGQRGGFRVAAHNVGPVPVSVAERQAGGALTERGRLAPGQRATLTLVPGAAALVRNLGQQPARLNFRITGDGSSGLGMGYEGVKP